MEKLPEELRKILSTYIGPLNKAVEVLLQQQTRGDDEEEEEFERNCKNVMFEYLEYHKSVLSTIREEHLGFLFKKTFCSTQVGLAARSEAQRQAKAQVQATRIRTPLKQTLDHAIGVITNFSRLMLEPDCRDHVSNHPDILEPYKELMTFSIISLTRTRLKQISSSLWSRRLYESVKRLYRI